MRDKKILINNIDKIHTTEMGIDRIKKNLLIDVKDVVQWCKEKILQENSVITIRGKNWYIEVDNCAITVNASSYTIITAHLIKKR